MLSILIPVYNFDVREFVKELYKQASETESPFEILCYDDGSSSEFKRMNKEVSNLKNTTYKELPENIGRSRIRNLLADNARFEYLLFLDCDSRINHDDFIMKYCINKVSNAVLYGGRSYQKEPPKEKEKFLRWLYGVNRECIPASVRRQNSYKSFMTNNFLIPKHLFNDIRFEESLVGYGHEDTLFGYNLKLKKIPIAHIDNPLMHIGLETAEEFIRKTEEGLKNLSFLANNKLLDNDVRVLNYFNLAKRLGIIGLVLNLYLKQKKNILKNLLSTKPNLTLFDMYKIGFLASLNRIN